MGYGKHRTSKTYEWNEKNLLGGGGFAKVYKGKHRDTGQEVAVKVCLVSNCQGDNERLYMEDVHQLQTFKSPFIIRYYADEEVEKCNPRHPERVIVMELANGSLHEELRKEENNLGLPMPTFLILVDNCLCALEYLDTQNLSHRDLKPENILVFGKENPLFKISDFGLQRQLSKRNQSMHSKVGTFQYWPSCVIEGTARGVDVTYTKDQFDLWSTSCCFFEAASNLHPFVDMTASSLEALVAFLKNRPADMVYCVYDALKREFICESEMPDQHSSYTEEFRSILARYFQLLFSWNKTHLVMGKFSPLTRKMISEQSSDILQIALEPRQRFSDDSSRSKRSKKQFEKIFDSVRGAIGSTSKVGVGTRAAAFALKLQKEVTVGHSIVQVGGDVAKVVKSANKVLLPVAIAIDAANVGVSLGKDISRRTTRNTVETAAGVAGGWGGGIGGAAGGAILGTAILPGLGTLIGGIIGGVALGVGGSLGLEKISKVIGNASGYNIKKSDEPCKHCNRLYKYPKYLRRDNGYCDNCQEYAENND